MLIFNFCLPIKSTREDKTLKKSKSCVTFAKSYAMSTMGFTWSKGWPHWNYGVMTVPIRGTTLWHLPNASYAVKLSRAQHIGSKWKGVTSLRTATIVDSKWENNCAMSLWWKMSLGWRDQLSKRRTNYLMLMNGIRTFLLLKMWKRSEWIHHIFTISFNHSLLICIYIINM